MNSTREILLVATVFCASCAVAAELPPFDVSDNPRCGEKIKTSAATCCLDMTCTANAKVEPFGVDMYVKSPDFGYYIFRGTRSVATHYSEAGWSIGAMKDGSICFSIADGKCRSYVKWRSIDTTWREGEWNHVAGSFKDGELTLWVNGEKRTNNVHFVCDGFKTNVCCVASIASPRAVVTNGCDAMTGGCFKGEVDDYRFLDHALSDSEVAARAAKVAEMRANDPDAPKMVPDELGIDVEPPCALPNTPLTIQPAPQKAELSDKNAVLEEPFVIVVPAEEGFAKTAGELFQEVIAQGLAMTAKVVRVDAELPTDGTRFTFEVDETLGKEAYHIKGTVEQGRCRVKIHGSDRGFFYAADTLQQLVRMRSIENGRRLSLPESFRIEDWPLMPNRVRIHTWEDVTPTFLRSLPMARVNGLWLNTLRKPVISEEKLREICKQSDSLGVDVVSGFGYLYLGDSRWTFAKPESMAAYKAQIDKLGKAGVKGLMFMFDDIQGTDAERMWSGNVEMRKRFRSQGAFQNALVHQGFDWAEAYPNLGSAFKSACPTYYFNGHRERRKAYLADFTKGFRERGVLMHHCAILPEDVAEVEADGAETYCYYLNGLWAQSRFFTWYTGPESFRWSWYTWHVDLNGKGPVVDPEAMEAVRTLHRRTPLFWCASAAHIASMQTGIISWNPAAYDPDLCDRATAQAFFGTGAYEQMRIIESALMPIIGYFGAYRTPSSNEFDVKVIPRRVGLSRKELAGYRRNYEIAEKAYAALEKAFADQKMVFDRPYFYDQRQHALAELRKTLDIVRKRLPSTIAECCQTAESGIMHTRI